MGIVIFTNLTSFICQIYVMNYKSLGKLVLAVLIAWTLLEVFKSVDHAQMVAEMAATDFA